MNRLKDLGYLASDVVYLFARMAVVLAVFVAIGYAIYGVAALIGR